MRARNILESILGRVRTSETFAKVGGKDFSVTQNFVPWWLQDLAQGAFAAADAIFPLRSLDWVCVSEDVA